ncbi:MAG: FMN-binding negative transcriptional regulator [Croceitalea sp.]|nr:FMN-binding negative transcriptional regulator [Croceitalea sp.]MBT8238502.1 FMN-binding negative transcriptional regulator [Croceitalea sp.]NNC35304.1 FMN-binding negative transcriptional regulator [Croceitalea sp.]NNM19498.1 FMN-binding negative transcriptional regulator [Croceitalea sp.]
MYIPHYYKNEDLNEIKAFITQNAFGILINQVDGKPWATHIPLELEEDAQDKGFLVGHIAKANQQWRAFSEPQEVLCIFNGPHSYVSSSWYQEEEVPTWDYIAVHVYGQLKVLSEEEVMQSLHKLVNKYEKESKNPISLHDMKPSTLKQVKGVVGFKIEITEIQAAYKLSQTRPEDHAKIIEELSQKENAGSKAIAKAIKEKS